MDEKIEYIVTLPNGETHFCSSLWEAEVLRRKLSKKLGIYQYHIAIYQEKTIIN
tara:strand:+ start:14659 stop:14820 length:162 start_codon:yes stop_codon:yes gene_type:complete